jgi:hypothetical protein
VSAREIASTNATAVEMPFEVAFVAVESNCVFMVWILVLKS